MNHTWQKSFPGRDPVTIPDYIPGRPRNSGIAGGFFAVRMK